MFCEICQEQTKYVIDVFSRFHLKAVHGITMEEYYNKCLKKHDTDGLCVECRTPVKFRSLEKGYPEYCQKCFKTSDSVKQKIKDSFKTRDVKEEAKKRKDTCLEKYGVSSISQLEESKEKSRLTCLEKYGVAHTAKLDHVKEARVNALEIHSDIINEKRKEWWKSADIELINSRRVDTCLEKYGVCSVSKVDSVNEKIRLSNEESGRWLTEEDMDVRYKYWLDVRKATRRNSKILFDAWDGKCFYTGIDVACVDVDQHHALYPTIDHKISIFNGYKNGVSVEEMAEVSNLCICCRSVNSSKNRYNYDEYDFEKCKERAWKIFHSLKTQDIK